MENQPQLWDKLFKIIGDYFPNELLDFLFHNRKIKFCEKFEQERIVLEYQVADINFWVLDNRVKKLLNIEPYSHWNRQTAAEVFTRNAIISKSLNYKHDVISVVVLLSQKEETGKYETTVGEHKNHFNFPIVNFADVEEILKKYPPLAPFVLKMDMKYQDQVIQITNKNKILRYMTVLVLIKLGISQEEALKMTGAKLEEFKEAFMEVPLMQDLFKEVEEKRIRTVVKNLLKEGIDKKTIAKVTGLKLEEIEKIKVKRK